LDGAVVCVSLAELAIENIIQKLATTTFQATSQHTLVGRSGAGLHYTLTHTIGDPNHLAILIQHPRFRASVIHSASDGVITGCACRERGRNATMTSRGFFALDVITFLRGARTDLTNAGGVVGADARVSILSSVGIDNARNVSAP